MIKTPKSSVFTLAVMLFYALIAHGNVDSTKTSAIQFTYFEAVSSARIVHFKWGVEWEKNGDYFVIEKLIDDGENWRLVAKVKSVENQEVEHTYETSEINMAADAIEVFRILRVDFFGDKEVLDSVNVYYPILSNLKLIPDPKKVNKSMTISWESMIASRGFISIYDDEGELVYSTNLKFSDGYNRLEVTTKNFESGRYRVVLKNEFEDVMTKALIIY